NTREERGVPRPEERLIRLRLPQEEYQVIQGLQEGGGPNTPIHHPQLRMKPLRETEPSHGVMELHPRRIEGCESPPELWKCLGKPQDHLPETARGLQVLRQIRVYLLHIITYSHHHHLKRARRALAFFSTTLSAGASRSTHSNHGCA